MNHLSVKGVSRRYLNLTGNISVRNDILTEGDSSLRSRLEDIAREAISFSVSECIFDWTARYQQTWSHILIRIRLNPDDGISNATINNLRTTWEQTIEQFWSDKWGTNRVGELFCPFTFEVLWINQDQHHTVRIRIGTSQTRSNMTTWHTNDNGNVAAHEYGHMLGHVDEYSDGDCPDRDPVNTGTIMDNNTETIPSRLIRRFADRLEVGLAEVP